MTSSSEILCITPLNLQHLVHLNLCKLCVYFLRFLTVKTDHAQFYSSVSALDVQSNSSPTLCILSSRHWVFRVRATVQLSRRSLRSCGRLRRSWRNRGRKGRRRCDAVGDFQPVLTQSAEAAEQIHAAY